MLPLFFLAIYTMFIMEENKMDDKNLTVELAKVIYDFMNKSHEHGNAVMDLLGSETHNKVIQIVREEEK